MGSVGASKGSLGAIDGPQGHKGVSEGHIGSLRDLSRMPEGLPDVPGGLQGSLVTLEVSQGLRGGSF